MADPQRIEFDTSEDGLPLELDGAKASKAPERKTEFEPGKGLDVGTANLLAAHQKRDGKVVVKRERNMFLEVPSNVSRNRSMLTQLNVPYVSHRDRLFVLGDSSFSLANMFGREVRRPMMDGFLSPRERDAIPMVRFIVERLLGQRTVENEKVFFSVPASSIDKDNDTIYHQGVIESLLKKLGYDPHPINEGHAVVYAELAEEDFTGIGISCGGGMFNVCVSYKTIPAVMFSVCRGGDWIDEHVAKVMGLARTRATDIKESEGLNLLEPRNREEEAVVLYYRNLIEYLLRNLAERFTLAEDVPSFPDPVEIVLAGGTSLVGGFCEVFAQELRKVEFPLKVAGVRRAEDALTSVARGCLIAAALDQA
ncbi:MAG: disk-shape morphogenesis protein volactin [Planctomycetota bacterium]|jgi:actin-like ATPase involved in cell morphogenesis